MILPTVKGLYLAAPHGRLIYDGDKSEIALGKPLSIEGDRIICSKEDRESVAFGRATIGTPTILDLDSFDAKFSSHHVTRSARKRWWPDSKHLYLYPVLYFAPYDTPIPVDIAPGTTMDMGNLVTTAESAKIMSSSGEKAMPYTVKDPPRPAKNWTTDEKKKCVSAANAVLAKDGDEKAAIFACIRAAGKTKHPGGKSIDPEDYIVAQELTTGFMTASKTDDNEPLADKAGRAELPDSAFLYVEPGEKADGKTPDSLRHLPYKTADGSIDLPQLRNAIARANQIKLKSGDTISPEKAEELRNKARKILKSAEGKKAGHDGDSDASTCTCPNCKKESEVEDDIPCNEQTCPNCRGKMQGGEAESEKAIELDAAPEPDTVDTALKSDKGLGFLTKLKNWVDSILTPASLSYSFKTYTGADGQDWFEIWPTNAYEDRDGEFFTSKAIEEFVSRHQDNPIKGELWYHHAPGSKFGTIRTQAVVSDHFLVQLGTFDDTPIGRTFKAFFAKYPHGHPAISPNGWGASHGYNYVHRDRIADGVYNWFDTKESSVLPVDLAANPYNPRPEVFTMNDKQKAEIEAIGGEELLKQIASAAAARKAELEGKVERKSTKTNEQVPNEDESQGKLVHTIAEEVVRLLAAKVPTGDKEIIPDPKIKEEEDPSVKGIAAQVADELQLGNLSKVLESIAIQQKELATKLETLQEVDETKVAAALEVAPRFAWYQASKADGTLLTEKDADLKVAAPLVVPAAISGIAAVLSGE